MNKRKPYEFQMSLFDPVLRMMLRGVKQNLEEKVNVSREVGEAMEERLDFQRKSSSNNLKHNPHLK